MTGCYAQTELGHGSNVAGLETTATYDKERDEFIINTPNISASKFWPGEMGKSASVAAVYAKLIINGKSYGVHAFFVPLRDPKTWEHLPGIESGDIGPKFGYNSKDNGYLIFRNVRIPRENLFKRYAEVDKEGNFKVKGDLRVLYSVMLITRVTIAAVAWLTLGQALTIATRYSVVRRQFST